MGVRSVATISSPEFIEIKSISPFVSKCEVKVFYLGKNRNKTAIDKATAKEMAQTLPGCPVVGAYSENKEDFGDHGKEIIINGDGIQFKCKTVPYGFIAPDTKVWFQDFEETNEKGETVIRTYLMTEAYLWTGQYEEAKKVYEEGRPHSMELDKDSMKGFWSTDRNCGYDFFIINDAIFSKLCILGNDVEPCFEGSEITAPDISSSFEYADEDFTKTLFTMMEELKELTYSLKEKGGNLMPTEEKEVQGVATEPAEGAQAAAEFTEEQKNSENLDNVGLENTVENQNNTEEFSKKEDKKENDSEEEKGKDDSDSKDSGKESDDETGDKKEDEDEDDKKKKNNFSLEEEFSLIKSELAELKSKYASLEEENYSLKKFKADIEDKEKDALIESFYMLSDEDKEDVIKNKADYTLDDIEAKLSVICVRKKVNFNLNNETNAEEPATTFNLNTTAEDDLPAWLKAVEKKKQEKI